MNFRLHRPGRSSTIPNETQIKFGYPQTLIKEYAHWCVLLRPHQATLGALVLVCTDAAKQFSEISQPAFAELDRVVKDIEHASRAFRKWDKINYLMLMMVDPDVHFHVLPRYEAGQTFDTLDFADTGWPGLPDLKGGHAPGSELLERLAAALKSNWPEES